MLTTLAWIIFRSETITDAILYIKQMLSMSLFSIPEIYTTNLITIIIGFIIIEWIQRKKDHLLDIPKSTKPMRWAIYYATVILIGWFGKNQAEFIYFQSH